MATCSTEPLARNRFGASVASNADATHAQRGFQLLLTQDGSTTRLCATIATARVRLHRFKQSLRTELPEITHAPPAIVHDQNEALSLIG